MAVVQCATPVPSNPFRPAQPLRVLVPVCLAVLGFGQVLPQQPTWRLASGTPGTPVRGVDVFRAGPDTMFAICSRYTWRSTDRGENWDSISWPGTDFGAIKVDPANSQLVYISTPGIDMNSNDTRMSTDGGQTWNWILGGRFYATAVIEFDPVEAGKVYLGVGPNELFRCSDTGQHWDTLGHVNGFLNTISIARTDNQILFAGYVRGVSKSTDRGATWMNLNLGFQPPDGIFVAVDPRDADIVYAGVWNNGAGPGGMYKSTDGGSVWNEINNGIGTGDRWIQKVAVNPKSPDEVLVGLDGSSHAILRTSNGGVNWSDFSSGTNSPNFINDIVFDTLNNRIYAAVNSGLYIHDGITSTPPQGGPAFHFDLFQNYPNPFNPRTTINYQLPTQGHVKLKLYDVLGREIATLVDRVEEPGYKSVRFDAGTLSSGMYFYRLQTGTFAQTRKLLVVK